ncbi:MAG: hypothetical protein J1F11_08125 [Oscillospiraceae bacterium]|nr:hypothetical protein [Oscillospiraceae bacterium]
MSENERDPELSELSELTEAELPDIDYVYGNEDYDPNAAPVKTYADLMNEESGRIRLEDMTAPKRTASESLKAQMMADDMAMSLGERPSLRDMSDKYSTGKNALDDLIEKKILNSNEKDALKTRLQEEISSRPEGFNQRRSLQMYHQLMDEQDQKKAQKGFAMLLILLFLGIGTAATEFLIDLNPDGLKVYMDYIHLATLAFSVLMLVRSKFFKILSAIYFAVNTVALIYPGLTSYTANPESQVNEQFIIHITMFVLAIIFSAITSYMLFKDKTIAAYYTKPKKK